MIHKPSILSGQNLQTIFTSLWNFVHHEWDASWQPLEGGEKHCAVLTVTQKAYIFGYYVRFLDVLVQAKQVIQLCNKTKKLIKQKSLTCLILSL